MKSKSLWELWETSMGNLHSPPLRSVRGVCQPRLLIPNSRLNGSKCSAPSLCGARFFFGVFFGAERGAIELMEPNPIEQVHLPHMGYFMGIKDGL